MYDQVISTTSSMFLETVSLAIISLTIEHRRKLWYIHKSNEIIVHQI